MNFIVLEFRKKEDAMTCFNIDGAEYRPGFKLEVQSVQRFVERWNDEMDGKVVK